MYPPALAALHCPGHPQYPLTLAPGAHYAPDGAVERGQLVCAACRRSYAIRFGIADLLGRYAPPDSVTQLINYLPPTAWGYERLWRRHSLTILSGEAFSNERELALVTGLTAPERGGLYLDIACSTGLYARALEQARRTIPGHVVGIDHALPMLKEARTRARAAGLAISFVRTKAQALPFADGAAAGIVMGGSLNEIGDTTTALREIRRLLDSHGRCVLMNLVRANAPAGRTLQSVLSPAGLAFWPLNTLNHRLADSGLRRVAQWQYGVVLFSLLLAAPGSTPRSG